MSDGSTTSEKFLTQLVEISSLINQQRDGDLSQLSQTMDLIVNSVSRLIPDSSAMIYTYDVSSGRFDPQSRYASSGDNPLESDVPRLDGLGTQAIRSKKQVFAQGILIHPVKLSQGYQYATCFPLLDVDQVLGVFYVFVKQENGFEELALAYLKNLANLTTMTLAATNQYKAAQKEKKQKDLELKMLRRAGMLISSRTSLSETLEVILKMALEITDAKYGIFRLVDKQGKNLLTAAFTGEKQKQPATESLPIDENSITGLAALNREPVMVSDLTKDPWKKIYYPFDRELEMRSELAVPLIGATGRLEGVLNLESPLVNGFNKQDRYILQILATQAVASIQEIRLLDMLQELTSVLLTQPLQITLQTLVEKACDLLNTPLSFLWLFENQILTVRASTEKALVGKKIKFEPSDRKQVLLSGETLVLDHAVSDLFGEDFLQGDLDQVLIVPLFALDDGNEHKKSLIGALVVCDYSYTSRDFNLAEWDKKVLNILGYFVILAIQNAERQEDVRIAQEQRTVTEAFAAIGDIASNLMHQLNNKIGTIPVRIEGVQDKSQLVLMEDPYLNSNLNEIDRSAREAMTIVRDGLFHLRPIQLMSVAIAQALQQAILTTDVPPEIELSIKDLEDLPEVYACPKRLPLVFHNLLDNAIRALDGKGNIRICGKVIDDFVEISVEDNGPGIKPEDHEKIFELNYSNRSSDIQHGLGFGLWWVKTLMVRFGGGINVESDGFSGSKFVLTLPLMKE